MPKAKKALVATPPRAWLKPDVSLSLVGFKVGIGTLTKEVKSEGHKYDPKTGRRVEQRWALVKIEDKEKDVYVTKPITGYETEKGVVTLDEQDKEAIKVGTKGVIDLVGFCDYDEIPSLYPISSYNIWPDGAGQTRAFGAVMEALRRTGKVGVGTCALTNSTRIIVVRWDEMVGHLILQTCNFNSSIKWNEIEQAKQYAKEAGPQPTDAEVELACEIVLGKKKQIKFLDFAATIEDDYQIALAKALKTKAAGRTVKMPKVMEPDEPADLMEALRASVAQASKPPTKRVKAKASR